MLRAVHQHFANTHDRHSQILQLNYVFHDNKLSHVVPYVTSISDMLLNNQYTKAIDMSLNLFLQDNALDIVVKTWKIRPVDDAKVAPVKPHKLTDEQIARITKYIYEYTRSIVDNITNIIYSLHERKKNCSGFLECINNIIDYRYDYCINKLISLLKSGNYDEEFAASFNTCLTAK
jgi:hypothetical protein